MSQWRAQFEDISEPQDVLDAVSGWYHVPALVLLLGFILWNRVKKWERFIVDGQVYFSGNDPWYHLRMVTYTVNNWPKTMPFDPMTYFPYGTHSSQFGTIMDQLIATAALIIGLGNPSENTIALTLLFAPAVFGTLAAIPVYFIGKRVSNRFGGLVAVTILAFSAGSLLTRSLVGFSDHHVAEAFFQGLAILAVMVAISVGQDEKPVWELLADRDFTAMRRPLGFSLLAGFGVALYLWTWPPGVFLLGILAVFFAIELSSQYAHGNSPEHLAIVGAVTMTTAGLLALASLETTGLSPTGFTLLQPGLAFATAAGCAFMAWLAREWDARDLPRSQYPLAIGGIILGMAVFMAVLLPDLWGFFVNQTLRVIGLSSSPTAGTVGEAQGLPQDLLYRYHGLAVFTAGIAAAFVFAKQFTSSKPRGELTLLAVVGVFMTLATLTQGRFDYYLVLPIAGLNAYIVGLTMRYAGVFDSRPADIEAYQVLTVVTIFMLIIAPLLVVSPTAMARSNTAPGNAVQAWDGSLEWMQGNTPEVGEFAGANNSLDPYGTYKNTEDFDYPKGSYGVMSWWDYGHWITVNGDRIPTANPFQLGAEQAANFLISPNESQANDVLAEMSEDENTKTRYVMVDWKMVSVYPGQQFGGKFFAPPRFYSTSNVSAGDYYQPIYRQQQGQLGFGFFKKDQDYYNSTMVRLYRYHGSAVEPQPVVVDWEVQNIQGGSYRVTPQNSAAVKTFGRNMTAAEEYVANDPTSQIGGIGPYPTERVPAMEHYRLVQVSNTSAVESGQYKNSLAQRTRGAFPGMQNVPFNQLHRTHPSWVKVFEKVDGATVEGQGPANSTVTARVQMDVPGSNTTFTYTQRTETGPNGEFTMTLPYSTIDYDEWGTKEGYTDPRVRANTPYQFSTGFQMNESGYTYLYSQTANVTEGQVIGENNQPVTVELEKNVLAGPQTGNETQSNQTSGNSTNGGDTGSDTSGNETGGNDTSGSNPLSVQRGVADRAESTRLHTSFAHH